MDVQAVLNALTDEFMSTSVVKVRAGIASTDRNTAALAACLELERQGLAEHIGCLTRSSLRWRRTSYRPDRISLPMNVRCDHVHLRSRNAVAAAHFYIDVFGAREIRRDGSPIVTRVTIDLGGLTVFIEQAPEGTMPASAQPHLGIEHIGLGVADIEQAYAHVQQHGIEIISGINDVNPSLRTVFIKGPDGAIIELLQRLPHP
ncbi:VOC family protein [Methylobacterium sp. B4]|uniref:VOC family protein n=1 Tax=Methylobacterium sp. B4 TaxID=1938755 RepID=UPI000D9D7636|nr:VOC family protein [Methylobacterium sp. B4]PXW63629.1 catechol 2,3-dioxygenase-like lactoylglutathione lyase family enzyme [Methylobacterium sp. B4]